MLAVLPKGEVLKYYTFEEHKGILKSLEMTLLEGASSHLQMMASSISYESYVIFPKFDKFIVQYLIYITRVKKV